MPEPASATKIIDEFISLAKQLAKLPEVALPQYRSAATALYQICQKLLTSNENTSRWYHRFSYFDFRAPDARAQFLKTVQDYESMKAGPDFHSLKFRCGDIGLIYWQDIESKFGSWVLGKVRIRRGPNVVRGAQARADDARRIISELSSADRSMVDFIVDDVFGRIDQFVQTAERAVESDDMNAAETARLAFKSRSKDISEFLEAASTNLTELVIKFAGIARAPITLADI